MGNFDLLVQRFSKERKISEMLLIVVIIGKILKANSFELIFFVAGKFNPMSLSVKRKEKIHPPCSPEVWCQAGLVWSVKV